MFVVVIMFVMMMVMMVVIMTMFVTMSMVMVVMVIWVVVVIVIRWSCHAGDDHASDEESKENKSSLAVHGQFVSNSQTLSDQVN
jgi:Ca2+/Na+ antiporter